MVKHRQYYETHTNVSRLEIMSPPPNEKSCLDCTSQRGWSSIWTLMALSSTLKVPVKSVYPPMNGKEDYTYQALNFTTKPRDQNNISFTSKCYEVLFFWYPSSTWTPNHFVALLKSTYPNHDIANCANTDVCNTKRTLKTTCEYWKTKKVKIYVSDTESPSKENASGDGDPCNNSNDDNSIGTTYNHKYGRSADVNSDRCDDIRKRSSDKDGRIDENGCFASDNDSDHSDNNGDYNDDCGGCGESPGGSGDNSDYNNSHNYGCSIISCEDEKVGCNVVDVDGFYDENCDRCTRDCVNHKKRWRRRW